MTGIVQALDELIAGSDDILASALQLQSANGTASSNVKLFQDTYQQWLNRSHTLLPDFFKGRFWSLYDVGHATDGLGQTMLPSIRKFVANPIAQRPDRPITMFAVAGPRRNSQQQRETRYTWTYPVESDFQPLFSEQVNVLREARHNVAAQSDLNLLLREAMPSISGYALHPSIQVVAASLFNSGHYDEAISKSIIAVNETVRARSGSDVKDGQVLMQTAFSQKAPLLRLSQKADEQKAYMDLFASAWSAVRSPRAHSTTSMVEEAHIAIEWIAFASALMRLVDSAQSTKGSA